MDVFDLLESEAQVDRVEYVLLDELAVEVGVVVVGVNVDGVLDLFETFSY